jgi:FixJ family two-component response regulator
MLKASEAAPAFPLVMMSSYASKQMADEALAAGAIDFVTKSPEIFLVIADIVEKNMCEWQQRREKNSAL